jgi:hypothetical protein
MVSDSLKTWRYIQTLRTTKLTTQNHTHSSMSTGTSKYCKISIALKQFYVSNWIQITTCNAILLTPHWCEILVFVQYVCLMWDTGLCTVRMSRSVDNCITQCPLNLTSEHIKTLLHHYYVLRYLERTPASYSPCTDITSLHSSKHYKCTLQNMAGSGNICISAVPNSMTCDIDRTQGMRF